MTKDQSEGREKNAAQPLGKREGLVSDAATKKAGKASTRAAGSDGPSAAAVGDTFKR